MTSRSIGELYEHFFDGGQGARERHADDASAARAAARRIVADLHPRVVLHAGCGAGRLVEALRQQGVEAYGIDRSETALAGASAAVRPYCQVCPVGEPLPLPGRYDLVIWSEGPDVAEAERALETVCAGADDVLVVPQRPGVCWAEPLAHRGYYRDLDYDTSYLPDGAARYRKGRQPLPRVIGAYEQRLRRVEHEFVVCRALTVAQRQKLDANEIALRTISDTVTGEARAPGAHGGPHAPDRFVTAEVLARPLTAGRDAARTRALAEKTQLIYEKNQLIQELVGERLLQEKTLKRELRDRDTQLHEAVSQRAALEQTLRTERAELIRLRAQAQAHERAAADAARELAARDQTIAGLGQDNANLSRAMAAQTAALHASRAWRLVQKLRALRHALLPRGSRRERAARLGWRGLRVLRRDGVRAFAWKACRKVYRKVRGAAPAAPLLLPPPAVVLPVPGAPEPESPYEVWIRLHEPSAADLEVQRHANFTHAPLVSVVVPTFNTPPAFLTAMVESVRAQTYPNWELCIADGSAAGHPAKEMLADYARRDGRIKVRYLDENLGIAGNSNAALALATGDFVALLDHDDTLAPFALYEVVRAINLHPDADFFYSDEDKIDEGGTRRRDPHFKPDWSPDMLRSHNYICHLSVFRNDLMGRLEGFRPGFDGSQDYDLILRATEQARAVVHIPQVLYHWRVHQGSVASGADVKMYAYDAAKKALREHLVRWGWRGEVRDGITLGVYQTTLYLTDHPLVSVIIPNRDNADVLRRCLDSLGRSSYAPYEVLVIENNSRDPQTFAYYRELEARPGVRVLNWTNPFNYSAVNNFGVRNARGDVLLFLNNDVEAIHPDWMERMLEHLQRPEVGAVGAKLYYPDNTVQHGGVIVGLGGIAGHQHHWFPRSAYGYFGRLIVTHNLSAVTAACLMTKRKVYDEVAGFDERFPLAFNDVDFCVKVRARGYLIVWTPFAELYHWESKTRGQDDTPAKQARFRGEVQLFAHKWLELLQAGDPYYNPNLTLQAPDCSFRLAEPDPVARLLSIGCTDLPLERLRAA